MLSVLKQLLLRKVAGWDMDSEYFTVDLTLRPKLRDYVAAHIAGLSTTGISVGTNSDSPWGGVALYMSLSGNILNVYPSFFGDLC